MAKTPQPPQVSISNTAITNVGSVASSAVAAVEAIARAAEANANALKTAAEALKPSPGPNYGIYVEGPRHDD